MNDKPISESLTEEILNYLSEEIPKYDLVILSDFGHGFINENIRNLLQSKSKFLSINVQSNSANIGYNYISNYKKTDFIVINEEELRLPLMRRFEEIREVINKFNENYKHKKYLITLGKKGSIYYNQGKVFEAPIFINRAIDTIGAGDAVFAISSLFAYLNDEDQLIPFIANCSGGLKSNYMGNKESVTKDNLLKFITKVFENELD